MLAGRSTSKPLSRLGYGTQGKWLRQLRSCMPAYICSACMLTPNVQHQLSLELVLPDYLLSRNSLHLCADDIENSAAFKLVTCPRLLSGLHLHGGQPALRVSIRGLERARTRPQRFKLGLCCSCPPARLFGHEKAIETRK